jgi:predicted nucleotidyltransferase
MDTRDVLPERISLALAGVPGGVAVVLGGSRAAGSASSDTDVGLYFSERARLDVERLHGVVRSARAWPSRHFTGEP